MITPKLLESPTPTRYKSQFFVVSQFKPTRLNFTFLFAKEKCCGWFNYTDWWTSHFTDGNHYKYPDSCCKTVKEGCGTLERGSKISNFINTEVCKNLPVKDMLFEYEEWVSFTQTN